MHGRQRVRSIVWLWSLLATAIPFAARCTATPTYDIREIQYSDATHNWESPHQGEIVRCVGGIITHKFRQRFALQDPSLGSQWAAIEVRGYPVYPTGIEVGDQVDFDSVYVDEYRGTTVLQYYNASSHTVNSSGNPIPDAVRLALWNIRYPPSPADAERYAGMLVYVEEPMTIGEMDLGAHEDNYELIGASGDTVAWASDYANCDLDPDSTYVVHSGEQYWRMFGMLQRYTYPPQWEYYQLLPRMNADYTPYGVDVPGELAFDSGEPWAASLYPNPFRRQVSISFMLMRAADVRCDLLDATGRCVVQLIDAPSEPGRHEFLWDGRDGAGRALPAGVYFVWARAGGRTIAEKLCLAR